jgi:hypothetical protein
MSFSGASVGIESNVRPTSCQAAVEKPMGSEIVVCETPEALKILQRKGVNTGSTKPEEPNEAIKSTMTLLKSAVHELNGAHEQASKATRSKIGVPATFFANVSEIVNKAIKTLQRVNLNPPPSNPPPSSPPESNKPILEALHSLQSSMKELERKYETIETKITEVPKTYAEIIKANPPLGRQVSQPLKSIQEENRLRLIERKQEKSKLEITLTTITPETRTTIGVATHEEITKKCQTTLPDHLKPLLQGVQKLKSGDIRIKCDTPDEVNSLKEINWSEAFPGLYVKKPKYGIVIHGVPTNDLIASEVTDTQKEQIERQNAPKGLIIESILPLRRKRSEQGEVTELPRHHSIIIFTHDARVADKCIRSGVTINYCIYPAERYCPQLKLTQCYNCFGYGHNVLQCRSKAICGKCSSTEHNQEACKATEPKCAKCNGNHHPWALLCPKRIEETKQLANMKKNTSPYYCSNE